MFSRFTKPAVVFILALSTAAGCAAPTESSDDVSSEVTGTQTQALGVATLVDTAVAFGAKAGPVVSVASSIYAMYQDVPGKLEAMNSKLDTVINNTAEIQRQVSDINAKLDAQFQADVVGPIAAAENYIAIDMKNQMTMLAMPGNEKVANDWDIYNNALNIHYAAADAAGEKLLAKFFPPGTQPAYTAAQWNRIFGLYLRASLVKVAIRDAKATLATTYFERTQSSTYAAAQTTTVGDLEGTVNQVVPKLESMKDSFVTARNMPNSLAQQCYVSGTYQIPRTVTTAKGGTRTVYVNANLYAFRDPGASYTSANYKALANCNSALSSYKAPLAARFNAWVHDNMEAPTAGLEAINANWATF
jgi:hypothetical protein